MDILEQGITLYQVPSKTGGPPEKKEALLEEHDPVWLELRHAHIADVCLLLLLCFHFCLYFILFICKFYYAL